MTHVKPEGDCYKRLQEILKPFDENDLEDVLFRVLGVLDKSAVLVFQKSFIYR